MVFSGKLYKVWMVRLEMKSVILFCNNHTVTVWQEENQLF